MDASLTPAATTPVATPAATPSRKPDDFPQSTLKDMKAAVWTTRHCSGAEIPDDVRQMLLSMGWTMPGNAGPSAVLTPAASAASAPTPEVAKAAAPSPEVAKAAAPSPQVAKAAAPTPEVAKAAAPTPEVAKAAAPSPEVAKAAAPTPEVAQVAAPTPEVAKAAAPSPEVAKAAAPSPEVAKAAAPTPEVAKAAAPGPEVAKAAAPTPEVAKAAAPAPQAAAAPVHTDVAATPTPSSTAALTPAKVEQPDTYVPRPPATPAVGQTLTKEALAQLQQHQQKKQQNALGLANLPDPNQKEYSRRAAANLIQRLKDNPSRMKSMPALEQMVNDDSKKSELITLLCESQGAFERVGANLQAFEEHMEDQSLKKRALRWTKKEMEDHYGPDAEKVMKHKTDQGLTEDDENNPGGVLYLVSRKVDETATHTRHGPLALPLNIYILNTLLGHGPQNIHSPSCAGLRPATYLA